MFPLLEIIYVFEDIKNYGLLKNTKKYCTLCNDGFPLKTYTLCDGCQKPFCLKHRPPFVTQWFCPICENSFKNFIKPLKEANIREFFKKLS